MVTAMTGTVKKLGQWANFLLYLIWSWWKDLSLQCMVPTLRQLKLGVLNCVKGLCKVAICNFLCWWEKIGDRGLFC